jgi:DNA polymerase-3 subunit delta
MAKKTGISIEQIMGDLKKKQFAPVYFLEGEEPYFIDLISDYVAEHAIDESEREFNQSILYGKDVNVLGIISEAKRFPMMADKQVVIIKEAQNVAKIEDLEQYVQNPQRSTVLVICYKYKELDRRKSFPKTVEKFGILFNSAKLYDNAIPAWIEKMAKEKKVNLNPKAALLLAEYLGNDLSRIVNEFEKMRINLKNKNEVTVEDIQNNIGISKEYNVFELQNAIGSKDVLKANRIINYFAANPKDNPMPMIMANLYGYFVKILLFHTAKDKSNTGLASAMKVSPFFVKDYQVAAANYPASKLIKIAGYLREYDLKSKGMDVGDVEDGGLLKELLFKILH